MTAMLTRPELVAVTGLSQERRTALEIAERIRDYWQRQGHVVQVKVLPSGEIVSELSGRVRAA